ncbi:MAG: hypothetical protein JNL01_16830 [Bdellovibrionales bacterium]|nr:hypothetical protein [Bdellovibrionales bacterium]
MNVLFHWITITSVWATTFVAVPFSQTVKEADTIVRGKIGDSHVDWSKVALDGEGSKRIYTYYELKVDEVVKGNLSNSKSVIIRQMGGEKDGVGLSIPGSAKFSAGEDVVVMLGPALSDQTHDLMGLMVGKLQVVRDEKGQEVLKGPAVSGDFGAEGVALHGDHRDPAKTEPVTLEGLRRIVKETVGSGTGQVAQVKEVAPVAATPAALASATPNAAQTAEVDSQDDGWSKLKSPMGFGLVALFLVVHFLRRLAVKKNGKN